MFFGPAYPEANVTGTTMVTVSPEDEIEAPLRDTEHCVFRSTVADPAAPLLHTVPASSSSLNCRAAASYDTRHECADVDWSAANQAHPACSRLAPFESEYLNVKVCVSPVPAAGATPSTVTTLWNRTAGCAVK